eukprot:14948377-Ditylum_brightwellii.AAC.1
MSCAACLLEIVPNGFVCVSSPSFSVVKLACDLSRKRAALKQKEGRELHADHAHFVCVLSRESLWNLEIAKTGEMKAKFTSNLYSQMMEQDIPVPSGDDDNDGGAKEKDKLNPIDIGHHLSSLLHITCRDSDQDKRTHWLVIVYDDTNNRRKRCWSIDLPG